MIHVTHKSCLKLVGAALLFIATLVGVSISSVANAAQPVDLSITHEVKKSVACFSFARAQNLGDEVLNTYLRRIGKASGTAGAVYQLGYNEGLLDAYGYANASKFEEFVSVKAARFDAAKALYKLVGCTINESI